MAATFQLLVRQEFESAHEIFAFTVRRSVGPKHLCLTAVQAVQHNSLSHTHTRPTLMRGVSRRYNKPARVETNCTPCAASASLGRTPGTRCRSHPPRSTDPGPSRREVERSGEAEGTGTTSTSPTMRVTPPLYPILRFLNVFRTCLNPMSGRAGAQAVKIQY